MISALQSIKTHICDFTSVFLPTPMGIHPGAQRGRRSQKNIEFQRNDTKMYVHKVKKNKRQMRNLAFLKGRPGDFGLLTVWSAE